MNRGDRREPVFQDDPDRRRFLEPLAETCAGNLTAPTESEPGIFESQTQTAGAAQAHRG